MANQTNPLWRMRLAAALRTTLACTIVGCATLYSPKPIRNFLTYPSYSYMTTILIVSDATLGQTLMSCVYVVYATFQVMASSVLALWLLGPERFTNEVAAVAMAVSVFLVALPGSTPLMSKRMLELNLSMLCCENFGGVLQVMQRRMLKVQQLVKRATHRGGAHRGAVRNGNHGSSATTSDPIS